MSKSSYFPHKNMFSAKLAHIKLLKCGSNSYLISSKSLLVTYNGLLHTVMSILMKLAMC